MRTRGGIAALSVGAVGPGASALFSTWQGRGGRAEIARGAQDVVHALAGGARGTVVSDERILRAISYIKSHLAGAVTLEEVAEEACLSPSWFRHLFVEQTGTALRPYVLWRRFLRAWEVVMHGESLSTAAHEAGFADAAHLTRTSHRMFGFPPSALRPAAVRPPAAAAPPTSARAPRSELIDLALVVASELYGTPVAQAIQLAIEYQPDPPTQSGSPRTAPDDVLQAVRKASAAALARRRAVVERIAGQAR